MKKLFSLLLLELLLSILLPFTAEAQKKVLIQSAILDKVTGLAVKGSMVSLLSTDSTLISKMKTMQVVYGPNAPEKSLAWFIIEAKVPDKYILKVTCKGYDTTYVPVDLTKVRKREMKITLPEIYISRMKVVQLGEVKVVATKVKFYNKGDTIVYNADAFQLSQGSMLDELVRQLPGAVLKDDGRIYVNGKFVESLMLNGKDFFKGQNKVLLDNLPTYMVKDIKVYERSSDLSQWAGREMERKSLVMDVNLKKQYQIGWIGNIEAGAGTSDRYLARLFSTRFTDHSRLSIYGNINNINDSRKPGQNTEWTPEKMPTGMMISRMAGFDFNFTPRKSPLTANGYVQFEHADNKVKSTTNRTNFLSGSDTYDRIVNSSRQCDMRLTAYSNLEYQKDAVYMISVPQYQYHKYKGKGYGYSGTSSLELLSLGKQWVDSLFCPVLSPQLRQILTNRNMEQFKRNGHDWSLDIPFHSSFSIPHTSDIFILGLTFNTKNASNDDYSIQNIDYPSNAGTTIYRNKYSHGVMGKGYKYSVQGEYFLRIRNNLSLDFSYEYNQEYTLKNRSLYLLNKLTGWDNSTKHVLGELPSRSEYEQALDFNNSYRSRLWDRNHIGGLHLLFSRYERGKDIWTVDMKMAVPLHRQKMIYEQASLDTTMTRNKAQISFINYFCWISKNYKYNVTLRHRLTPSSPDLSYAANVVDDSNPLMVTHGNANLKDIYNHFLNLSFEYRDRGKQLMVSPSVEFNYYQNALAMGYIYDRSTGRRDITPENVNGNYNLTLSLNASAPVSKKKTLTFTNNLSLKFIHSVDLTGINGASVAERSRVMTRQLSENISVEKTFGRQKLSFKGMFNHLHSTGSMDNFTTINAYNYSYGLIGTFKLPWKVDLSTDISMYSRRGYQESAMNDNNLLWNARLSRSFFKGKVIAIADGFDILHQLSNVQRFMNAQARTETYVNSLPRYVMFHCIYRLNLNPKKKK
jgi:hypothetical protein